MAKTNKTKFALLGVLTLRPCSGYDIKKFCDNHLSHIWNENYGHIYPVLKHMENEGLVTKKTEHNEGRPYRNVYSITEKGKAELNDWLLLPVEPYSFRSELLLKMFFAGDIPISNLIEKLENKKDNEQKILEYHQIIEQMLKTKLKDRKEAPLWWAILSYGRHSCNATIAWCEETIKYLQDLDQQQEL